MTDFLLVSPIIVPLLGALVLIGFWGNVKLAKIVSLVTVLIVVLLAFHLLYKVWCEGILVTNLGDWDAPFGIVLVADLFAVLMVSVTALISMMSFTFVVLFHDTTRGNYIHPFLLMLLSGVNGVFMTGDLFNLFVFFEVTLLSSYALLAIGAKRIQIEAAFKYVVINVMASASLLIGIGLVYGEVGTLNMAHIAVRSAALENNGMLTVASMFLLTAFGVKSAIVPLHFWLPGAYTYISSGVAVFFGAVLTKVGVYSMIRIFGLALNYEHTLFQPIMLTIACLSILIGVLGALGQRDLRTILSWDVISQVGFMLLGLSLFTIGSVAASIFFMLQYMPTKAGLFLVSGLIERSSGTGNIYRLGGLSRIYPWVAGMFLIFAFSVSGIPPFAGFWAKLGLLQASFALHSTSGYISSGVILLGSVLTGFMMIKIWQWVFWGQPKNSNVEQRAVSLREHWKHLIPLIMASGLGLGMVIWVGDIYELSNQAASQILNPVQYIEAVNLAKFE